MLMESIWLFTRVLVILQIMQAEAWQNSYDCKDVLKVEYFWKGIDWVWPKDIKLAQKLQKQYIPENNVIHSVIPVDGKLICTFPRWRNGVGATIGYITAGTYDRSPKIMPYPSWESHIFDDDTTTKVFSNKIVSVNYLTIDSNKRIWFIDNGFDDLFGKSKNLKIPTLMIYDACTNLLIHKYEINDNLRSCGTYYDNLIVDTPSNKNDDTFAYVSDPNAYGLLVYNFNKNKAWRISNPYMHNDPLRSVYHVDNMRYTWSGGIHALTMSEEKENGGKILYFHPFGSNGGFAVYNKALQNENYANNMSYYLYLGSRGPESHVSSSVYDRRSKIIFYSEFSTNSVTCWNTFNRKYSDATQINIITDHEKLIFPTGLKIDPNSQRMWVLSNNLPYLLYSTLNLNKINMRVFSANMNEIISCSNNCLP